MSKSVKFDLRQPHPQVKFLSMTSSLLFAYRQIRSLVTNLEKIKFLVEREKLRIMGMIVEKQC